MYSRYFKVAGVSFEGRQQHLARVSVGDPARIIPEPENSHDPNALAVHIAVDNEVLHCGYVPRELAAEIAPMLDGEAVDVRVHEITGGFEQWDGSLAHRGLVMHIKLESGEE